MQDRIQIITKIPPTLALSRHVEPPEVKRREKLIAPWYVELRVQPILTRAHRMYLKLNRPYGTVRHIPISEPLAFLTLDLPENPPACTLYYLSPTKCKLGNDCRYAHDYDFTDAEIDDLGANAKKVPCTTIIKGMHCGDGCISFALSVCPNSNSR